MPPADSRLPVQLKILLAKLDENNLDKYVVNRSVQTATANKVTLSDTLSFSIRVNMVLLVGLSDP